LLPDGKILIAGGSYPADSAELYDPAGGAWTVTGQLNQARYFGYTATLLQNGKVLVAGGYGAFPKFLSSAELYDPGTGTWTTTGSLTTARYYHTATLLPNGDVLVTGGESSSNYKEPSAELYDPATGTWSFTGSLKLGV
jgi:N-acetylneuraminic acid mutarotase